MDYVDIHGKPLSLERISEVGKRAKVSEAVKEDQREWEKMKYLGWVVSGVKSVQRDGAKLEAERLGNVFDEDTWLPKASRVPISARKFDIFESALQLKAMAERNGYLDVRVDECRRKR